MTCLRRKRLLILTYEYPPIGGGAGKAAQSTARQLADAGYEVTVATSRFGGLPGDTLENGIRVIRHPVLRARADQARAFEVLSCAPCGIMAARGIVRAGRPDLVLAYMTIPCGVVARWIELAFAVPYFCMLRGQDVPGTPELSQWMHTAALPVTRHVWNHAERVIANSAGLADLARRASPRLDVPVVRNGVDTGLYAPAVHCPVLPDRPVRVIYTGRLVHNKCLRELFQAASLLRGRMPYPFEIRLAGDGPARAELERLAAELPLGDRVRFLGRLDERELIAALQSSDIFINPSLGEGLPNTVLEAMACALPVVVSDIPPHRELVPDEALGRFCDPTSPESIAAALGPLLESGMLRAQLGTDARRRVVARFSWERSARDLIRLIEG